MRTQKPSTKGEGTLGLRPTSKRRSIYVNVCAGIDHIATSSSPERAVADLKLISDYCNDQIVRVLAETVTGHRIPSKKQRQRH